MKVDFRFRIGSSHYIFTGIGDTEEDAFEVALAEFREVVCGLPIDQVEILNSNKN